MMNRVHCSVAAMIATLSMFAPDLAARQRGPVDAGPGTLAAARKFLEGRWRLLSFEITPGPDSIRVLGAGTLVYDDFGNLTIDIRVDPPTAARLEAAGIATTKGSLMTKGRTVIDPQARTLTFVLEGQQPYAFGSVSGPLALNRPRHWQVDGKLLTLTTKGDDGQTVSVGRWEKAP